jgi:hypothetical protein
MKNNALVLIALAVTLACVEPCAAQLFGPRAMGRSRSRASAPALEQQGGTGDIQGTERFLRGNRGARAFVGTSAQQARQFVGTEQATGASSVRTAVEDLREPRSVRSAVNQPRGPLRRGEIYERLTMDLTPPPAPASQTVTVAPLATRVTESLRRLGAASVEVSMEGRTATLRGTVASARQRDLAEWMVRFEPGISQVSNLLAVETAENLPGPSLSPSPTANPR